MQRSPNRLLEKARPLVAWKGMIKRASGTSTVLGTPLSGADRHSILYPHPLPWIPSRASAQLAPDQYATIIQLLYCLRNLLTVTKDKCYLKQISLPNTERNNLQTCKPTMISSFMLKIHSRCDISLLYRYNVVFSSLRFHETWTNLNGVSEC